MHHDSMPLRWDSPKSGPEALCDWLSPGTFSQTELRTCQTRADILCSGLCRRQLGDFVIWHRHDCSIHQLVWFMQTVLTFLTLQKVSSCCFPSSSDRLRNQAKSVGAPDSKPQDSMDLSILQQRGAYSPRLPHPGTTQNHAHQKQYRQLVSLPYIRSLKCWPPENTQFQTMAGSEKSSSTT